MCKPSIPPHTGKHFSDSRESNWIFQNPWNGCPRQSLQILKSNMTLADICRVRKFSYRQVQIDLLVTATIMILPVQELFRLRKTSSFTFRVFSFGLSSPISFSAVACSSDALLVCCHLFDRCCVCFLAICLARVLLQRNRQCNNL